MPRNHSRAGFAAVLLGLLLCGWRAPAQVPRPSHPNATHKRHPNAAPAQLATLPQTIRIGNVDMPLTDVVPKSEAAMGRLRQMLSHTTDPGLQRLQQAIDALSAQAQQSRGETLDLVRHVRSVEQLVETRFLWRKDHQELENLDAALRSYVRSLTEQQRQATEIQQNWSFPGPPPEKAAFPSGLVERIQQVQQTASLANAALRSTLESLVQLQVRISDTRKILDGILQEVDAAERRLQASIWRLDGPPLWSALRGDLYAPLREQARITVRGIRPQILGFYSSYRTVLLAYLIVLVALTAVFFHLRARHEQVAKETASSSRILQYPFWVAAFLLLSLFTVFFPNAPPEAIRFSQSLLIFPMLRLGLVLFDRPLRTPLIVLAVSYALDGMTSHMAAGTMIRRLLVLALSVGSLFVVAWANRLRSPVGPFFAQRSWTVGGWFGHLATVWLAASAIANLVGCVSLADLLLHGTLRSLWAALGIYLMYLVLRVLLAVLTVTRLGQASRVVRLHRELVLDRLDSVLKLAGWLAWGMLVLFAYQVAHETLAGLQSVLNYRWSIGAVKVSIKDVSLFFVVVVAASYLAKAVRFVLEEELFPRTRVSPGVAQSGSRLAHYALALIGFYIALAAAGMDLGRATLLTGAFGVGLGFGLQGVVSNFVSGIILSLERPMQIGDVIEVRDLLGTVTSIGFRSSTVRTADGADVIVPNSELTSNAFVNWSLTDQLRRGEVRVAVEYGADPACVLPILGAIAGAHPEVVKDRRPLVTFENFGEAGLEFCVRFWTRIDILPRVRSDLNVLIAQELANQGIALAQPQWDWHAEKPAAAGRE